MNKDSVPEANLDFKSIIQKLQKKSSGEEQEVKVDLVLDSSKTFYGNLMKLNSL